ncbi:MAG: archaellum operon transcriptional activator EarA family protein [Petrotogales bacterium]
MESNIRKKVVENLFDINPSYTFGIAYMVRDTVVNVIGALKGTIPDIK